MRKRILLFKQFAEAIISFFATKQELENLSKQNYQVLKLLEKNVELINLFTDLSVESKQKINFLDQLLRVEPYDLNYVNGLKFFIDSGYSYYFLDLVQTIDAMVLERLNIQVVQVQSAYELSSKQKNKLETGWTKKYNQPLVFQYTVIPEMVLGISVRINDYVEDYSLNSQLNNLKKEIKKINP
ncbi:ATP synthase F1 delta subunit [Mycoplasmoides fastidiosum]|uniref:ATP synthase subunit delta n=1 Tax=Mycoplasmoides fastidiosum TaxID=92758 RepID=A0ABU0LYI2_9BACT|nr:ATP synthase F1 subunit delta [Mycoplasmoides fastidiosum]MDQ0513766.1 ATP synthase F1 delta subunit [Mycoplasmoides fastidiosum]UUD37814.1 ATP synthase F1 subunit delta [Mycoplasmoides fastidiosum]